MIIFAKTFFITNKEVVALFLFLFSIRKPFLLVSLVKITLSVLITIADGMPPDCIVIDLRDAWEKLGEITGDTVGGDIINQIFTNFCIGK